MVQLVHYPLFQLVGPEQFPRYAAAHQRGIGFVVIPFMLIELATAALLVALPSTWWTQAEAYLGLGLLGAVWLSTFFLQRPAHAELSRGYDETVLANLVRTNWLRTALWTVRGVLVLIWFGRAVS